MKCSNKLSTHLVQHMHTDVALLTVLTTCQDIPIFHWNAHILLQVSQGCNLECVGKCFSLNQYYNTVLHLSYGFLMHSENYIYMAENRV